MKTLAVREQKTNASQLAASRKFSRYKKESEKQVRKTHVKTCPKLEMIGKLFEIELAYLEGKKDPLSRSDIRGLLKSLKITPRLIYQFCLKSAEYQDHPEFSNGIGMFLTNLMKAGKQCEYSLFLEHMSATILDLGLRNTKNIEIKGGSIGNLGRSMKSGSIYASNAAIHVIGHRMKAGLIIIDGDAQEPIGSEMSGGTIIINGDPVRDRWNLVTSTNPNMYNHNIWSGVGSGMHGGKIIVKGNTNGFVGNGMKGGEIHVFGDAGDNTGTSMKGGKIIIDGNTGKNVGWDMKGGEIHINGNYESIGDVIRGKIYHKGKLIVGK